MAILKKILTASLVCCTFYSFSQSTGLTPEQRRTLEAMEQVMQKPATKILFSELPAERWQSDSTFTRMLVRALQVPNSFHYPFDSLITISRMMSPDSSFRIFTWELQIDENDYRQHGAIQVRTADGSLKLFPLMDQSDLILNQEDTICSHRSWIGAVYYKIILRKWQNKSYYTLIGFDAGNIRSNRKIIEVLHFEEGNPVFGGPFFFIPNNSTKPRSQARFIMDYKKDAAPRLNYDDEMDLIVKEHLVSENGTPNLKWTLVGDGDYEAFKWSKGKWTYIEKLFDQVTPAGKPPVPVPLRREDGSLIGQ
jgi:hypothetical protein